MKGGELHGGYRWALSIAGHSHYFVRILFSVFVDLHVDL